MVLREGVLTIYTLIWCYQINVYIVSTSWLFFEEFSMIVCPFSRTRTQSPSCPSLCTMTTVKSWTYVTPHTHTETSVVLVLRSVLTYEGWRSFQPKTCICIHLPLSDLHKSFSLLQNSSYTKSSWPKDSSCMRTSSYTRSSWPKDSWNFPSFPSCWGDWPRFFFQYGITGPRHPGYFDSYYNDGIRPFPQRPIKDPTHVQFTSETHVQFTSGTFGLGDPRSPYMSRILSMYHSVICSLHHPSSVKYSQGWPCTRFCTTPIQMFDNLPTSVQTLQFCTEPTSPQTCPSKEFDVLLSTHEEEEGRKKIPWKFSNPSPSPSDRVSR